MPSLIDLRTSSLISLSPMYQATEITPIQIVATLRVSKCGCTVPNVFGAARLAAIESAERVAARIVVWHEADADVSTATISSLSHGDPSTSVPRLESTSSLFSLRKPTPW